MYHRLRKFSLSLVLAPSLGCVGSPLASETSPPKPVPKTVTVDAEWSSDEPNEELLSLIKQQKQISQREAFPRFEPLDQRGSQQRREPVRGDYTPGWQSYGAAATGSSDTRTQQMLPPQSEAAVAHAAYVEPADSAQISRSVVPTSSALPMQRRPPTLPIQSAMERIVQDNARGSSNAPLATFAKTQIGTSTIDDSPSPPTDRAASPSRLAPSAVCVKGVVADGVGQSLAMLQLDGGDTVVAREGDTFDIASGEDVTSVRVLQISDRSVSVQFGGQGKVVVLR